MSSNLKVNTILPSTGTAVGIGTENGSVDVLGHIVGHNTPNISGINSVTASHFYGSGANLTGITQTTINSNTNNYVVTATGTANTLQGESTLTFDGDTLLLKSSTDGRRVSFAGDGTSHYMKYDNTLGGIILNGYGGIAFETNGTNERLRITSTGAINCGHGSAVNLHGSSTTGINLNANNNSGQIVANASGNRALIIGRQSDYGQVIEFFQGSNTNEAGITIPAADTLGLETNGTERFRLKGDGVIEMGTSIGASSDANIRLRLGRTGDCFLGIRATGNNTSQTGIKFGDSADEDVGVFLYDHYNQRFQINVEGNTRIYIDGSGDLFGQSSNSNIVGFMGAKTTAGTTDWNHSTNARSGNGFTLLLGTHSNGPGPSLYYHPFTFEYAQRNANGNMTQLAIPYNGGAIYSRYRYSGSWSGWQSH